MLTPVNNTHQAEKPIFSSPSYLQSRIGYCDLCFAIVDSLQEFYFKCESCDDFIACFACLKDREHRLIAHPSDHLFSPSKLLSNTHWMHRHLSITCDLCHEKNFLGKRYRCRQCLNYNVCSNCLDRARESHYPSEKHTLDLIPNWSKLCINQLVLARRAMDVLRHRNAASLDRDHLTGWTSDEAAANLWQARSLRVAVWREAAELLPNEDLNSSPSIIEHEKSTKILISL